MTALRHRIESLRLRAKLDEEFQRGRQESWDQAQATIDGLRAEIASLRAQNEVTHKAYVEENNRLMAQRESLRAELAAMTTRNRGDMR